MKIIQRHHLIYPDENNKHKQEWTAKIYKGEHQILTLTQRIKHPSRGFLTALKLELLRLEYNCKVEDLE